MAKPFHLENNMVKWEQTKNQFLKNWFNLKNGKETLCSVYYSLENHWVFKGPLGDIVPFDERKDAFDYAEELNLSIIGHNNKLKRPRWKEPKCILNNLIRWEIVEESQYSQEYELIHFEKKLCCIKLTEVGIWLIEGNNFFRECTERKKAFQVAEKQYESYITGYKQNENDKLKHPKRRKNGSKEN